MKTLIQLDSGDQVVFRDGTVDQVALVSPSGLSNYPLYIHLEELDEVRILTLNLRHNSSKETGKDIVKIIKARTEEEVEVTEFTEIDLDA